MVNAHEELVQPSSNSSAHDRGHQWHPEVVVVHCPDLGTISERGCHTWPEITGGVD
eukprot:CAMPEP_0194771576 /NCGR_PEP_ID=MMETSP0323_2-20130528/49591_1 /TAXON_ID=2866 ORGANISM="Crypthecodinium cohnii, Strain Seligo" /NCGR_SAMPLE_ID=MMETSP0323_2 /ASSEMBLY_ACC=CAM_ASM_000346 /LENGTH=55 /DNA_ID=CAMNT_0039705737 /DNA_START=90 /DNA_END=254 /DNA_ORIENTATION=-